jgi:hypothetical protein
MNNIYLIIIILCLAGIYIHDKLYSITYNQILVEVTK